MEELALIEYSVVSEEAESESKSLPEDAQAWDEIFEPVDRDE